MAVENLINGSCLSFSPSNWYFNASSHYCFYWDILPFFIWINFYRKLKQLSFVVHGPWVCCDVRSIFFFGTWCFLCCCSPRLRKYYCSNLQSLSSSATFGFFRFKILMSFFRDNTECICRLKLGCFSTFQLLIFWLPKCLFCLFSHADFRLSAICSIFLPSPYMSTFEFFLSSILITSCRFWSPHADSADSDHLMFYSSVSGQFGTHPSLLPILITSSFR